MKIRTVVTLAVVLLTCFYAGASEEASMEVKLVQQLEQMFSAGGILMWLLLLCSVFGLSFSLERLFSLRSGMHMPRELVEHVKWLLEFEGVGAAKEHLQKRNGVLARSLLGVMGSLGDREAMRRDLEEELARALCDERRNIRPVGVCASVAPLIGLLGTVTGMIEAFRQAAASGMDNPALFANGIYQALYTTAFGLMVSIPCLVAAHYLKGRLELLIRRSEDSVLGFIDYVCECSEEDEEEMPDEAQALSAA